MEKNVTKLQFNFGIEHLNDKHKLIRGRQMKDACDLYCRRKCCTKITNAERQQIHKRFWEIPNKVGKWDFLALR